MADFPGSAREVPGKSSGPRHLNAKISETDIGMTLQLPGTLPVHDGCAEQLLEHSAGPGTPNVDDAGQAAPKHAGHRRGVLLHACPRTAALPPTAGWGAETAVETAYSSADPECASAQEGVQDTRCLPAAHMSRGSR